MSTVEGVLTEHSMPCVYYHLTIPIIRGNYKTSTRQKTERNDEGKEKRVQQEQLILT